MKFEVIFGEKYEIEAKDVGEAVILATKIQRRRQQCGRCSLFTSTHLISAKPIEDTSNSVKDYGNR